MSVWTRIATEINTRKTAHEQHVTDTTNALAAKADLSGGKIPSSQLPAVATGQTVTVANDAARFALTTTEVQNGDAVIQTDTAARYWITDDTSLTTEAGYTQVNTAGGAVDSVNGYTGIVVLGKSDVGLGSVDNVSAASLRDRGTHTGSQTASTISDFNEAVDDRVAGLTVAGAKILLTYDDVANSLTIAFDDATAESEFTAALT